MQEIHFGGTENLELLITRGGNKVNADGTVTVSLYDADDTTNTLLISAASAYNDPKIGLYTLEVNPTVTSLNKVLKGIWSYSVNGASTTQTTYTEVVTPYALVSDIVDFWNIGTSQNLPGYKSAAQIMSDEKLARTVIDGYTGQKFGLRYGSQEMRSDGSDAVFLTEPMLTIDQLYENGRLVIDQSASAIALGASFNNFGYPLELSQTNKIVRIVNIDYDVRYDSNIDPTILYYGRFRDNARYKFVGKIGYQYVPSDIKLAATLLVGDYLTNDSAWRVKYLKKISMSETTFELGAGAFNGTGNLFVDNILDQYRNTGIVLI